MFGRIPAHQHLEPHQPAGGDVDLRLEIGDELAARHAGANPGLDLVARLHGHFHAGFEPDMAVTALFTAMITSEEHTSELKSLMRISYDVFCLKRNQQTQHISLDII